ncbi:MAG: hypothetical protein O2816_00715 [Planctomycetota bacterium]|nr:hypothetical protein [Planctomycetota bacterium]
MIRKLPLLAPALLAAAIALPNLATADRDSLGPPEIVDPVPMYPVISYDVSGHAFWGPVAQHLVIYSNGRAQLSHAVGYGQAPYAFAAYLDPALVQRVLAQLQDLAYLPDESWEIADLPLQTLTTFDGQFGRSTSWWGGFEGHGDIEDVLAGLIEEVFPQAPGND